MAEHDLVATLRHGRQFFAGFVGPHAKAKESNTEPFADLLHLLQVTARFGAGFMQILQRRAGKLELASRLKADGTVSTAHRDDLATFFHWLPPEFSQRQQDVADTAVFAISGGMMVGAAINQLFVFGSDTPAFGGLLTLHHRGDQLITRFNDWIFGGRGLAGAHGRSVRKQVSRAPANCASRPQPPSITRWRR